MKYLKFAVLFLLNFVFNCNDNNNISYGIRDFPKSLDPVFGLSFDESQISSQIYEKLISLDYDNKTIKPHLALTWNISDDKCTYTFILRDHVYFHDGTKLSTQSVMETFKWLKNKGSTAEIFRKVKTINIIDSTTFQFILYAPYSIFLYELTSPESFQIISENALNKYDDAIGQHPCGTGAFFLDEWKNEDEIILKKFNNYWGKQGKLNRIYCRYYTDVFELEAEITNKNIDIIYLPSSYSVDRLKWTGHIDYYTLVPVSISFIGFNNKIYPFNSKQIRKAILKAINIPRLIYSSNRGNALVAKGPLPPSFFRYKEIEQAGYNFEGAKDILNENGISCLNINFGFPSVGFARPTNIEYIKYELEKIGIHLNTYAYDSWEEFDNAVISDSLHMFYNGGISDIIGDALNILYGFFYSKSEFNTLKYENPFVDRCIDEAIIEHDPLKRNELYIKIVNEVLEDTPAIFLMHIIPNFAYNKNKIKKIITDPYGIIHFNEIEIN